MSKILLSGKYVAVKIICGFIICFVCAITHAHARVQPDDPPITLSAHNVSVKSVLDNIERQTDMVFFYNNRLVNVERKVYVDAEQMPLSELLERIFSSYDIAFKVIGRQIALYRRENDSDAGEHNASIPANTVPPEPETQQPVVREVRVRGRVTDDKGETLAGVSVVVRENPGFGVMTNAAGEFSIVLPEGARTLTFTYLGMEPREVAVNKAMTYVEVVMSPKSTVVGEVVVTGYSQTTTKKITGSVGVLTADKFNNKPLTSVDALLQGQLAGVVVSSTSGQPGRNQSIRIRGTNTINGTKEPLWVVDGIPLQEHQFTEDDASMIKTGALDNIFTNGVGGINPGDIENVTVLKDAAAAAIYGSRASAGVIVVTTKSGGKGRMTVNYSSSVSVTSMPGRDPNLMNSAEKLAWETELWNDFSAQRMAEGKSYPVVGIVGMIKGAKPGDPFYYMNGDTAAQDAYISGLAKNSTNWHNVIFRNSVSNNHHLSLGGGSEFYRYYASLGYTRENGILLNDSFDRYNFNGKFDMTPKKFIRINLGVAFAKRIAKSPALDSIDPFSYAYFANPYEKPYNDDGSYSSDMTFLSLPLYNDGTMRTQPQEGFNILRELNNTHSDVENFSGTLRGGIDINIFPALRFSGLASYTQSNSRTERILESGTYAAFGDRLSYDNGKQGKEYGSITQSTTNSSSYMLRGHFMFDHTFGSVHSLSLIAGSEIRSNLARAFSSKRYGYDALTGNSITPMPETPASGEISVSILELLGREMDGLSKHYTSDSRYASFYASADYYLGNRYVINFSFRTDGSSNFGSDEQFNPTWSAGAAWHVAEERFWNKLHSAVNRLTIRAATGFTGNVSNGVNPQMIMYYKSDYRTVDNEIYRQGTIDKAPNKRLRWERTQDYKVAVDFGLLDERISGAVEAYWRYTTDAVSESPLEATTGWSSQKYNSTDILNRGIETTLSGVPVRTRDFTLTLSVNVGYNVNKVTRYEPRQNSSISKHTGTVWEGYPMESVFGGKVLGINEVTGLYDFVLRPDATINKPSDFNLEYNYLYYLGTYVAPFTGGFSVNAAYRSFSLLVSGYFSYGSIAIDRIASPSFLEKLNWAADDTEQLQTYYNDLYRNHLNVTRDATDRWTPQKTTGVKYPVIYDKFLRVNDYASFNPMSDRITQGALVQDNSFLRINTIMLRYDFRRTLIEKAGLNNLSLYVSLNNFFTFTRYEGLDPEVPGATYPVPRSIAIGLNLGF